MSDLVKAFAGLKGAKAHPAGTQAPKRRFSFESSSENMRAIGESLGRPQLTPRGSGVAGTAVKTRLAPLPLQGTAKSRHPEYTPVKVFLRKDTHKAAGRKWQDDQETWPEAVREREGGDFSDLVEHLLQEYLRA